MSAEAIKQFQHLVRREALRVLRRVPANVERDDLEQAGMMGLLDAHRRYRPTEGATFEAFAAQRIRGAILDELRRSDWASRADRASMRRAAHVAIRLRHQLRREPTEGEIAAALDMTLEAYRALRSRMSYQQVNASAEGERSTIPLDQLGADSSPGPATTFDLHEREQALLAEIERLPPREREVVEIVYRQGRPLKAAGDRLGVTESRACQIGQRALERLRIRMAAWR